MEKNSQ
jgi:hypothetical protein